MKKNIYFLMTISAIVLGANAGNYITSGDGKTYTFAELATKADTPVAKVGSHSFYLKDTLTVANGDKLELDEFLDTVFLGNNALIDIQGQADFQAKHGRVVFTRYNAEDKPLSIIVRDDTKRTVWKNVDVEYVGVRCASPKGFDIDSCSFCYHNGENGIRNALALNDQEASLTVRNSLFAYNSQAAIGGAANYCNNVTIEGCIFRHNVLSNKNMPQINLTVADSIIVRHNTIIGDSTKNYSGGLGVSNLMGFTGDLNTIIEDNQIDSCRYGLTLTGPQNSIVCNNSIRHNRFETNANNGGSGISLYDPYYRSTCKITGNLIEDNLWGMTIIGGGDINLGKIKVNGEQLTEQSIEYNPGENTFINNGNNGIKYDLYNNGTSTVYAQGNTWNVSVQDSSHIEEVVTHKADNESLGLVIFTPSHQELVDKIQPAFTNNNGKAEPRIYTLDGKQINNSATALPHGIYIIKDNKGTHKTRR